MRPGSNLREILKELAILLIVAGVVCAGYLLMQVAAIPLFDIALEGRSIRGFVIAAATGALGYLIYRLGIWVWTK